LEEGCNVDDVEHGSAIYPEDIYMNRMVQLAVGVFSSQREFESSRGTSMALAELTEFGDFG
jgi:hypothetical protein